MFCSNCGKTLSPDDVSCQHCGAVVGDSRFDGHPYTGAQVRTKPGEAVRVPLNHTRTTYMGSEPPEESEIDARTTYRATRGGKVPKYAARRESFDDDDALYDDAPDYDDDYSDQYADERARDDAGADDFETQDYDADDFEADDFEAGDIKAQDYDADDTGARDYEADDYEGDTGAEDYARGEAEYSRADSAEAPDYPSEDNNQAETDLKGDSAEYALDEQEEDARPAKRASKRASRASKRAAAEQAKADALDDDDIDPDELRARDIKIPKKRRISEDVRRHIQMIDEERVEQEMAEARPKKKLSLGLGKKRAADESEFDDEVFRMEEDALPDEEYEGAPDDEYISDEELLEDDDFDYKPRRKRNKALRSAIKYSVAAVLIVCMLAGIIVGLSYLTDKTKTAPIEGVTVSLYEEGIKLIESRATEEYRDRMLNLYGGEQSGEAAFLSAITLDLDSIAKLMPESPAINDKRFINALESIQQNINNALTNSVQMAKAAETGAQPAQDVESQWSFAVSLVATLKQATTTALLDAIITGERITVIDLATPTPPPVTPPPVSYTTLSRGSKGEAVTALQNRLKLLGYLDDVADGSYGPKTAAAVKLFEQEAGLEVDGIADEEMQTRLFSENAPLKRTSS